MRFVVLLGAPGAGKGTQARLLHERLGLPQIATGDLFRANLLAKTELGESAKSYMVKGELVPDSVTVAMVKDRLSQPDCAQGALFDGFPATLSQASALDELVADLEAELATVIHLQMEREGLLARVSGRWTCRSCDSVYHVTFNPTRLAGICDFCGGQLYQRTDDTESTQSRRIEVYINNTRPVLDYYRKHGKVVEINGDQSIAKVHRDLVGAISAEN